MSRGSLVNEFFDFLWCPWKFSSEISFGSVKTFPILSALSEIKTMRQIHFDQRQRIFLKLEYKWVINMSEWFLKNVHIRLDSRISKKLVIPMVFGDS